MSGTLSARNRVQTLQEMTDKQLDVLVVGGGITGAGIAWDASKRGMRTGLVEMGDFASGTSSRSTKLVHGGLRYLKQGEIKLVMEVGRERSLLHRQAPHLVIPAPMLMPIYKGGTYGYLASTVGLLIYDLLAGVRKQERRKMLSLEQTIQQEPLLNPEGLIGGGFYYEYRTDDARLTLEIIKNAHEHGAMLVNYTRAYQFIYRDKKVVGVTVVDEKSGEEYAIYAKKIVNAAGPWVDRVRTMDHIVKGKKLLLTKGVHLVVDYARLPVNQAAYFDVPDGRMIFVIPREGKTYIGTTDTVYNGDLDKPQTSIGDRDYLISAVNAAFPSVKLTSVDVESVWAGLRPLIHEEGKGPSEISRRDEIFVSPTGLITIAGGKLTGFRKMAEKVVNLVAKLALREEGITYPACKTDQEIINGGSPGKFASFEQHKQELLRSGIAKGLMPETTAYLLALYGSNTTDIYRYMDEMDENHDMDSIDEDRVGEEEEDEEAAEQNGSNSISNSISNSNSIEQKALRAELAYCMEHEMTVTIVDFIVRRTGLLFFNRRRAEAIAEPVIRIMAKMLGWDEAEQVNQRMLMQKEFDAVTHLPEL